MTNEIHKSSFIYYPFDLFPASIVKTLNLVLNLYLIIQIFDGCF